MAQRRAVAAKMALAAAGRDADLARGILEKTLF
jgi:hypothetical protein